MVKHDHAAGEYNQRRADCETAARILAAKMPDIRALRDVSLADLERYAKLIAGKWCTGAPARDQ